VSDYSEASEICSMAVIEDGIEAGYMSGIEDDVHVTDRSEVGDMSAAEDRCKRRASDAHETQTPPTQSAQTAIDPPPFELHYEPRGRKASKRQCIIDLRKKEQERVRIENMRHKLRVSPT
jgi:hypothetical protein